MIRLNKNLPSVAKVESVWNIGPATVGPCFADFEILHMWDTDGQPLDIENRDRFAPIPSKSFECSPVK